MTFIAQYSLLASSKQCQSPSLSQSSKTVSHYVKLTSKLMERLHNVYIGVMSHSHSRGLCVIKDPSYSILTSVYERIVIDVGALEIPFSANVACTVAIQYRACCFFRPRTSSLFWHQISVSHLCMCAPLYMFDI